jgi:hypothetical protein
MTALGKGIRVKCVNKEPWDSPLEGAGAGPAFGSIWTVGRVIRAFYEYEGPWLELVEWLPDDTWFNAQYFVPLDGHEDLSALLAALKKGPLEGERDERVRVVEPTR